MSILTHFGQLLTHNIWLAVLVALLAGMISSFSPCVLSAMSLVISYVGGYAGNDHRKAFKLSLLFCMGMTITLITLGIASALLGRLMTGAGGWWYILLGIIMTVVGLQMLGIINFVSSCYLPRGKGKGLGGALLLGIIGGIMTSPCATPVLVAILAFIAEKGNLLQGIILMTVYSIGHCTLLLVAGTSVGFVQFLASSPGTKRWGKIMKVLLGILVLIMALYLFYLGF
jgi:cytochrome c-type biogenesis protein